MRKFTGVLLMVFWITSSAHAFFSKTDFAGGSLVSGLLNGDGSGATFTVSPDPNAGVFPTGNFLIVVWSGQPACSVPHKCANREIIWVNERTGNVFQIASRNMYGTTHSGDWPAGSRIEHTILAENLQEYEVPTPEYLRIGLGIPADASAVMVALGQYYSAKYTTSTTILNWNNGNVQYIVLTNGSQIFTFSNPKDGGRYALILKQPASGTAGTVTWPAAVKWSGGTTPILTTTNGKTDVATFIYDGTNGVYYSGMSLNY